MNKGCFSKEYIARNIKKIRNDNDFSISEFACQLGVSKNTILSWEMGKYVPCLENIVKVCNIFNVTIDSFILYK